MCIWLAGPLVFLLLDARCICLTHAQAQDAVATAPVDRLARVATRTCTCLDNVDDCLPPLSYTARYDTTSLHRMRTLIHFYCKSHCAHSHTHIDPTTRSRAPLLSLLLALTSYPSTRRGRGRGRGRDHPRSIHSTHSIDRSINQPIGRSHHLARRSSKKKKNHTRPSLVVVALRRSVGHSPAIDRARAVGRLSSLPHTCGPRCVHACASWSQARHSRLLLLLLQSPYRKRASSCRTRP